MTIQEIKQYLESNKENKEVQAFVQGLNPITLDRVKTFVGTDKDAIGWLDSEKDKHHNKALETWKSNNVQKLIDEAVAKSNPTETPEQKEIRELKARLDKKEVDEKKQALKIKALEIAESKELPTKLVKFFLGEDEESTTNNLEELSAVLTDHIDLQVKERLGDTYQPPGDESNNNDSFGAQLAKQMGENAKVAEEAQKNYF